MKEENKLLGEIHGSLAETSYYICAASANLAALGRPMMKRDSASAPVLLRKAAQMAKSGPALSKSISF